MPCADGAGEIATAHEDSTWKTGDRVVISVSNWLDWTYGEPPMGVHETGGKGAGDVHGTLREYAVLVSHIHAHPSPPFVAWI